MQIVTLMNVSAVLLLLRPLSTRIKRDYVKYTGSISKDKFMVHNTIATFEIYDVVLKNATTNENIVWNPMYNCSTSDEYTKLSKLFCQLLLIWANSVIYPESDSGKCTETNLSRSDVVQQSEGTSTPHVIAKSKLVFTYPFKFPFDDNLIKQKFDANFVDQNILKTLKLGQYNATIKSHVSSKTMIVGNVPSPDSTFTKTEIILLIILITLVFSLLSCGFTHFLH